MRALRNIIILFLPYMIIILVNELVRSTIKENRHIIYGIKAINSNERIKEKCTWIAHETTAYCKKNHVKFLNQSIKITDKLYFGIINILHSTGSYRYANIFILVLIFPLIIWFSLVKTMNYSIELLKVKKDKNPD
jgi:hypothetical protein